MERREAIGAAAASLPALLLCAATAFAQTPPQSEALGRLLELKPAVLAEAAARPSNSFANYVDLGLSADYNFVIAQLRAVGITESDYPQLYAELRAAPAIYRKAHTLGIDLSRTIATAVGQKRQVINTLSPSASGSVFEVQAVTSVPFDPYAVVNTLGLYAMDGSVVAPPTGNIVIGGSVTLNTYSSAAFPTARTQYNADGIFAYIYPAAVLGPRLMRELGLTPKDAVAAAGVLNTVFAEDNGQTVITNIAPTDVNQNGYIKICIARSESDCDYSYGTINGQFILQVPLNGNVAFPESIKVDPSTGRPANAQYSVAFWYPEINGGCAMPDTTFANQVQIPSNNVLSWNIAAAQFGQPSGCNVPNGQTVDAVFQLTMAVQSTSGTMMPATITSEQGPPVADVLRIYPVEFVYGCLPVGTMVTMAEGKSRRIETLHHGDKVRSGAGALTVDNYMTGSETHQLVRAITANGFHVSMTDMHPVPTQAGIKLAKDLAPSDVVTTLKGQSPIVRVERIPYNGKVWNLDVGLRGVEPAASDMTAQTFFADGVLVGDGRMQAHYARLENESPGAVLSRLPPEWRTDFYSAQIRRLQVPQKSVFQK